jgi:HK97 family phage portal protein
MSLSDWFNKPSVLFNAGATDLPKPQGRTLWPRKHAGIRIDHDNALTISAVFRAIKAIAEPIATLQWSVLRDTNGKRQAVMENLKYLLHRRPNPEMSAFTFRQTLMAWALSWGNGYAEIEFNLGGQPIALWPISPDRVEVKRDDATGDIVYEVSNSGGGKSIIPASKMFHVHGLGFDGLTGYSVISLAARSLSIGMAAEEFGASFFGNGAIMSGTLEHPGKLSDPAFERLKKDFETQHSGVKNAGKPLILEEGMKWAAIGLPPGDAQFLETRKFSVTDIARWFGVPPHKLYDLDRATFSNIEHQSIEFVVDTLMPWVVRLEQEADYKLIKGDKRVYTKLNLNALMRGDSQSRANYYREMRNMGVFSANDICELEDRNGIGVAGDKRIVQLNMTTLDRIGEEPVKAAPTVPSDNADPQQNHVAMRIIARDVVARICRREHWSTQNNKRMSSQEFVNYHKKHLENDLLPVVSAYLALNKALLNHAEDILNDCVDTHLGVSIVDYEQGDALNADGRIDRMTDILLSRLNASLKE